tara:strand:+ start:4869 stop:5855 length:987 start_codon:yes stop_codon:yes gene_type:complete
MSKLPVHELPTRVKELDMKGTKVHHLPDWEGYDDPQKLAVIRKISEMRGRDPRIAQQAVGILKKAKVKPRQYKKQAAALLRWVQSPKNVYYVNEPGERLQDPIYTLKQGHGDCDDQITLLCALFESIRLPWKLVISGREKATNKKVRYIEGSPYPQGCAWSHIYCMVGTPPFRPDRWYFCECTVEGVPLGWDVVSGDHRYLPEMMKPKKGPVKVIRPKAPPPGFRPKVPRSGRASPAYQEAYGQIASVVGASVAEEMRDQSENGLDWRKIAPSILTGVAVAVGTQLTLDWIRGKGIWDKQGNIVSRSKKLQAQSTQGSLFGAGFFVGE